MPAADAPPVAEIVLVVRGGGRLTAGFAGWQVSRDGDRTVLRRAGATRADVHDAFVEVAALGLDLESFRRLDPGPAV